ncbi:hypothetical protein Tco_0663399 [Tanacetum coccineum]
MMCTKMVLEEEDRVEKFIGGLLDNIQGNVIAAEPTRLQDVVQIANHLMDKNYGAHDLGSTRCFGVASMKEKSYHGFIHTAANGIDVWFLVKRRISRHQHVLMSTPIVVDDTRSFYFY